MTHTDNRERSVVDIFIDASGYSIVALACSICGYALTRGSLPDAHSSRLLFVSLIFLGCYFFSREVLLEQNNPVIDQEIKNNSIQWPLTISVIVAIASTILGGFGPEDLTLLALVFAPFLVLGGHSVWLIYVGSIDRAYSFRERVFFPALASCSVPFAFGWALGANTSTFLTVGLIVVAILSLKMLSIVIRQRYRVLIALLAVCITVAIALDVADAIRVALYSIAFSLAMGVAETCKRVTLIPEGRAYYPPNEDQFFYLSGSTWASIVFPILLCLATLTIQGAPTWPVYCFAIIQTICGLFLAGLNPGSRRTIHLVLGYLLPALIVIAKLLDWRIVLTTQSKADMVVGINVALGVALMVAPAAFYKDLREDFSRLFNHRSYLDKRWVSVLFLFVLGLALFLVAFLTFFLSANPVEPHDDVLKLQDLTLFLGGYFLVWFMYHFFNKTGPDASGVRASDGSSYFSGVPYKGEEDQRTSQTVKALIVTLRPTTSMLAAFAVFSLAYALDSGPLLIILAHGLVLAMITGAGFAANDVFDIQKDRRAGRNRPIAMGQISSSFVRVFAGASIAFALSLSYILGGIDTARVAFVASALVLIYSPLATRFPRWKGAVTAVLCLTPIAYAEAMTAATVPSFFYLITFGFILGREVLLDVKDAAGDHRSGMNTLPIVLGLSSARRLAWALMYVTAIATLLLSKTPLSAMAALGALATLICASWTSRNDLERSAAISRTTLGLGILSLALSL